MASGVGRDVDDDTSEESDTDSAEFDLSTGLQARLPRGAAAEDRRIAAEKLRKRFKYAEPDPHFDPDQDDADERWVGRAAAAQRAAAEARRNEGKGAVSDLFASLGASNPTPDAQLACPCCFSLVALAAWQYPVGSKGEKTKAKNKKKNKKDGGKPPAGGLSLWAAPSAPVYCVVDFDAPTRPEHGGYAPPAENAVVGSSRAALREAELEKENAGLRWWLEEEPALPSEQPQPPVEKEAAAQEGLQSDKPQVESPSCDAHALLCGTCRSTVGWYSSGRHASFYDVVIPSNA
ncbi:hypothetical protein DIPPA_23229 [Diplonema papillatum]|nr:hypothetical protein DIPPA_23229 [Diplonema papillatum]KAJ9452980.1 hypothetical protein DIPPA_23229 [Diplonema papillatum]KAJ9452981.1 hypothetical protein DIPPA_23229 [Diplonema papillatum]